MDIWRWVNEVQEELTESGRPRLAELIERIPGHVVNHEHAQLDAIVPEALALAREAKSPWLEIFIRHWNLQSRILHRHEATAYLPEAVRLLELASRDEARECPQSVCVIQDLAGCYAELDGPGYAPERLAVARETLARIDAKWPCFTCISSEYAFGLIDDGDAAGALAFVEAQTAALVQAQRGAAAHNLADARIEALLRLARLDEALEVAERAVASEVDLNDHLSNALNAARVLARLGRHDEALRELPPIEQILPTPSLYERWAQATHALALAGAVPSDWKLDGRLFELQTRLADNGVIRTAIAIAHQRAELAIARDRLGTAEHAAASIRELIPRLRRSLGADDDLAKLEGAIAAARDADADPRFPPGSAELALAQLTSDPERDLEILAAGRARFPDEERLAIIQASARRAISRYAEAEAGLRAHLTAFPGAHGVLMTLGQSLLDQRRSVEARELAEASLLAEPKGEVAVGAHFLLATAFQQEGERDKARPHLEAMLTLEPGNKQIELLLASLDRDAGRLDEALARLSRLVEREPRPGNHDWDLMVVATLAGRWDAVRASAIRIGMKVEGEGPIDEAWGLCRIELREPDGEVSIQHALRTGPVTARILDVARPRTPQHHGDEIVFEAAPRNAAPKPGEVDHSYVYPAIATRKPGGYEAFLLDGVHPGRATLDELRRELTALGCVLAVQNEEAYVVTSTSTGEAKPGLYAYLAAPEACSRQALHELLTRLVGSDESPLVWPGLAQALELEDELVRQAAIIERLGL
ncbi:MAG: tetratricopeptide repeat protein [Byssovorax sp.]